MQERPHWQTSENDDDADDGYTSERPRPSYATPHEPERLPPPPPPARAPLEGVISWRQHEELWNPSSPEKPDDTEDDDEERDEEEKPEAATRPVTKDTAKDAAGAPLEEVGSDTEAQEASDVEELPTDAADHEQADTARTADEAFVYPEEAPRPADVTAERGDYGAPESSPPVPQAPRLPRAHTASPPFRETAPAPTGDIAPETPYYYQAQPVAEAPAPPPQYYEQQAVPPPGVPPEVQANQPPLPPAGTEASPYAEPPERPEHQYDYDPASYPAQPGGEYAPAQQQASPGGVPAERASVPSHRHGEPLAAVVGIGLVAEHIGRKRADRRQQKQIDRFAQETRQQQEQQRVFTAEQQRQTAEMQRMRTAQERFGAPAPPYVLENAPSSVHQQQRVESAAADNQRQPTIGRPPQPRPEGVPQVPGQAAEQQFEPTSEETLVLQPQQHVEHSAWHNIIVDKHGHEVAGGIAYGQEFHRQREHEMLQDRVGSSPAGMSGVAGGAGQQQGQGQPPPLPPYQQTQGTLPSGMTNPALPTGQPSHVDPQHQLAAPKKQIASNIANPWFWLMLVLIVAAFFTAALI